MARNPARINVSSHVRVNRSTSSSKVVPSNWSHKRRFISSFLRRVRCFFCRRRKKFHRRDHPSSARLLEVPLGCFRQVDVDDASLSKRVEFVQTQLHAVRVRAQGDVCKTRDDDDDDASHRVRRRHHHASSLSKTTFLTTTTTTRRRSSKNARRVVATSRASLFSRKASKHQRERERERALNSLFINGVEKVTLSNFFKKITHTYTYTSNKRTRALCRRRSYFRRRRRR